MKKIVIIGAGAMGSAFSIPCADNSNEVILVGSFLEDKIIDQINNNKNQHPVLNCQLPKNVKVIKFSDKRVPRHVGDPGEKLIVDVTAEIAMQIINNFG